MLFPPLHSLQTRVRLAVYLKDPEIYFLKLSKFCACNTTAASAEESYTPTPRKKKTYLYKEISKKKKKKKQVTWTTLLNTAPSWPITTCPILWKIHSLITWNILETSSELRCCATSHSLAVISIRRQMSMSTFMAFSWIFVSRSVMGCRKDSSDYLLLLYSSGKQRYPTVSL